MSAKLGDILIQQGVIDEEKLIAALSDQRAFGGKLGRTLVDLGYVTEEQLVNALATQLGLDTIDLAQAQIAPEALSTLPFDACERYGVFPVRVDRERRVLWLATAEPDQVTLQEVAQIAQHTLEPILCTMSSIDHAVRRYYFGDPAAQAGRLGDPLRSIPGIAQPNGDQLKVYAPLEPRAKGAPLPRSLRLELMILPSVRARNSEFTAFFIQPFTITVPLPARPDPRDL